MSGLFCTRVHAQTPIVSPPQQPMQARSLADPAAAKHNGAMTTSVEIAVPKFRGITPQLSLAYDSSSGNGFVGVGWNLVGFSRIERASPGHGDSRLGQSSANDLYLLDGEELVASTALGGNFATKRQSFQRIVGSGTGNWTVTQPDGTIRTYTPQMVGGSTTLWWGISKIQDTHGNVVNYSWWCDPGTVLSKADKGKVGATSSTNIKLNCYPSTVSYADTVVTFYTEERTDVDTFATGYRNGQTRFRLRSVGVTVISALYRGYKISYKQSARTGRSLVTSIKQFGKDASIVGAPGNYSGGTSLPPVQSLWNEQAAGLETAVTISGQYNLALADWQNSELSVDDFNGDGRADFLLVRRNPYITPPNVYLLLANSTGSFNNAVEITTQGGMTAELWKTSRVAVTGDFDGDGRADLLLRENLTSTAYHRIFRLMSNAAGGFNTKVELSATASGTLNQQRWTYSSIDAGDFNGDGKADLLLCGFEGGPSYDYILLGDTATNFKPALEVTNLYGMTAARWNSTFTFGDFNGDGKTDILARNGVGGSTYILMAASTGGFVPAVDVTSRYIGVDGGQWSYSSLIPGDFNGDGRTDILMEPSISQTTPYWLFYGNGSDGTATGSTNLALEHPVDVSAANGMTRELWRNTAIHVGDFNGDRRSDIFIRSPISNPQENTVILFSNGKSFEAPLDITNEYGMNAEKWAYADFMVADFDGDGDDEILRHSYAGGGAYATMPQQLLMGAGRDSDLLRVLTNSMGGATTVTYAPSSAWPNSNNPPLTNTVRSLSVKTSSAAPAVTNFAYQGGAWDRLERRHLGFRYSKTTRPSGAYEETYYYQGEAYRLGEAELNYRMSSAGSEMQRTYRLLEGSTGSPWSRLLTRQDDIEFNADATYKQKQTTYTYDGYGNMKTMLEHGEPEPAVVGDEKFTVYSYALNATNYLVNFPSEVSVHQGTDATGALLQRNRLMYDNLAFGSAPTKGDLTTRSAWLSSESRFLSNIFTFDAYGNQTSVTDAGQHTTYTYYLGAWGTYPTNFKNALDHSSVMEWDVVCQAQVRSVDPNQVVGTATYDGLCRRQSVTEPGGKVTTWSYVNLGDYTSQRVVETTSGPGVAAVWKATYLDGAGREWQVTNNVSETVETVYDADGRVGFKSAPFLLGQPKQWTSTTYDALDRPIVITNPDNSFRRIWYNAWSQTSCDELGNPTFRVRDAYGKVRLVREFEGVPCSAMPACVSGSCFETQIGYDLLGNRVSVIDAAGIVSTATFDSLGRRTLEIDPDRGYVETRYNDDGLVAYYSAGRLGVFYEYDAGHRVVHKYEDTQVGPNGLAVVAAAGGSGGVPKVDAYYYYDEPGNGASIGRRTRTSVPGSSVQVSYGFDDAGRVIRETTSLPGWSGTVNREYDGAGRELSTTYPDGERVVKQYDAAGRLFAAGSYITSATYNARGDVVQRTYGNGLTDGFGYDPQRQWMTSASVAGTSQSLLVTNLEYNDRGDLTRRVASDPAMMDNWTYQYDDRRRLELATNNDNSAWSEAFTFDAVGRVLSDSRVGTFTYRAPGSIPQHAPATLNGVAINHDGWTGNLWSAPGLTASYNAENRVAVANGLATTYDADGNRVKAGSVVFAGSGAFEYDTSTGVATNYIFFGQSLVARKSGTQVHYLHGDQLGTVAAVSDATGQLVTRTTYTPFGARLQVLGSVVDPFGLAGQRLDQSGLYHMGAREMWSQLSMFITPDPSDEPNPERPHTLNRFAYALNSPTNLIDPTGYAAEAKRNDIALNDYTAPYFKEYKSRSSLFLAFTGAGGNGSGGNPDFILWAKRNGGDIVESGATDLHLMEGVVRTRVFNVLHPDKPIYYAGYSAGGFAALWVATWVERFNIQINGLVTFDPVKPNLGAVWNHFEGSAGVFKAPGNVQVALNFYQRTPADWGPNSFFGATLERNFGDMFRTTTTNLQMTQGHSGIVAEALNARTAPEQGRPSVRLVDSVLGTNK